MSFSQVIGQQKPLNVLRSALAAGRLHHGYLFLGPESVGKRFAAVALAKALHCDELIDDFCGRCVNCLRIDDGNHPDVRIIEPQAGKKEISIQQIRDFERALNYRSFTGKRKVAIFDPATLLNLSSQNALLKTLEEPPENSLMILVAVNEGGLLPTLRSRCMRLSFAPLARQEVADYLQSRRGLSRTDAASIAALSMGSMGVALALNNTDLTEKRNEWSEMLGSLKMRDYRGAMATAEVLAANRDEALNFLKWAESWYRDLLSYAITGESDELVNLDMLPKIEQQSTETELDIDRVLQVVGQTSRTAARIQRNLNRRMVLEKFLFGAAGGR